MNKERIISKTVRLPAITLFLLLCLPMFYAGVLFEMHFVPFMVSFIIVFLFEGAFSFWLYCLGYEMFNKMTVDLNMSFRWFTFNIIYSLMYWSIGSFINVGDNQYFYPFDIFASYSGIYILYFLSKYLVSAEMRTHAKLGDYFMTIILFMIFPIGVWVLKHRIDYVLGEILTTVPNNRMQMNADQQ